MFVGSVPSVAELPSYLQTLIIGGIIDPYYYWTKEQELHSFMHEFNDLVDRQRRRVEFVLGSETADEWLKGLGQETRSLCGSALHNARLFPYMREPPTGTPGIWWKSAF